MGWWNYGIMDGDTPLDLQADLLEAAGIPLFDFMEAGEDAYRDELEANVDKMVKYLDNNPNRYSSRDIEIGYQVLGVILMSAGAAIPIDIITRISKAGEQDDSETFVDPDERKRHLDNFYKAIYTYNRHGGTSVTIDSKGLFETIATELSN